MSARRGIRNPYRTPSTILNSAREKAIAQDRERVKRYEDTGFAGLAWTNSPSTVPTTPPASSSQDSLPYLSITPSSIDSSVIQTPGTKALEEVLLRHLDFQEVSCNRETYLGNVENGKSSGWISEPVLEAIVGNELELEIGQILTPPKPLNKYTWDSRVKEEGRESRPTIPKSQEAQHIARPSTPEHQIIRPYCASADMSSSHNRSQIFARQRQSASSLRNRRSSPTVSTVGAAITRSRVSGRSADRHLREVQRERWVSKEDVLAPSSSKEPDIAAWILGCEYASSMFDTSPNHSIQSDTTSDDSGEKVRLGFTEECTKYIAPFPLQAGLEDYIELARKHLDHLPDNIAGPILASLTVLFKSKVYALSAAQPAANDTSASVSFDSSSAPESSKSNSNSKKRASRDGDDELPDTDDEDPRKKQKLNGESNPLDRQKWACPFYQREPHRYCVETAFGDFRKCARSPGFDQVHRLKSHINKCHSPNYCDRCFALFKKEEDLEDHRRSSPACDLKQRRSIEGLTTKQKALLKPRDRKSKSDEERWNTIYRICFPQDLVLPSPYYVHYSQEAAEARRRVAELEREVAETRREVMEIIKWETRSPNEIDVNRLLQRVDEAFSTQMLADSPATFIPRTPLLLTPSTSHDSTESTGLSSQTGARDTCIESPSVKHCSKKIVLVTGSGNNKFPSSELLKPSSLPRPSRGDKVYSSDKPHFPDENDDLVKYVKLPVPIMDFPDAIKSLDFEQNQFDIAGPNQFNHSTGQPDLADLEALFDIYEEFETPLGDDTTQIFY